MSIEVTLLQLLKYRERYERLAKAVPTAALEAKSVVILGDYGKFFEEFPEQQRIELEPFMLWFGTFAHPTLTPEQLALYRALLGRVLNEDCDPSLEAGIMERLVAAETANRVTSLIEKYNNGDEVDLYVSLRDEVERFEQNTNRKVRVPWINEDIDSILLDDKDDRGLHWRLDCLNTVMRPLRGGDFIVFAGRPDKGKTTGISSEVTYMSSQFDAYYGPDSGRYALWMNNEGPGKRIVQRTYQSALNATMAELIRMSNNGTLKDKYADAVGGVDRIRIMDVHDFWNYEVEDIMRRCPPGLVVMDMVDNIKFGGQALNGGQRTDQLLEAQYQWARLMAVKYDTPIIATSQISADGDGMQFPTLPMLKDSKTGKQGAADAIITLGASNDPFYASSRWIGMTKNKLRRQGAPQSPQAEVMFDGERGRLLMPVETT
ncbi:DnaB-like helicase C-terminal domain-containing protein [Burkholderia pseudomallei]|uniref:DnaB-like helicase C-terminal domain-containing protein n=1 Tax=Burkholderia pseudomallei TaxID=28450 RepID=UPI0007BEF884|nr:DnaB-like helicase C-terminal domain-containing protein [Burkholderia pseudomallei]MBD2919390.1 AAA family ATPase [Burkholderia pseudomallei]MBD2998491.1 AAA family ATPase [Burkholderia pseudomallei]MBF4087005.1 AAA family ATPase [Burkholderia pseudomallei]MCW0128339.1 AAA family ATPase [Burkholderia pseudomallei]NAX52090.1 AAA family ATPase [Burkholderia pseudomallei]